MATVAQTLHIGPADHGRRLTIEEFEDAEIEEGYLYELARGILEVTQVPDDPHGFIVDIFNLRHRRISTTPPESDPPIRWCGRIPTLASGNDLGAASRLFGCPPRHSQGSARTTAHRSWSSRWCRKGAEARDRDYLTKKDEYRAFGILEYWILDREMRRVTVLNRDGDVWAEAVFVDGQAASGLVLPGFAVPVADLWIMPPDEIEGE